MISRTGLSATFNGMSLGAGLGIRRVKQAEPIDRDISSHSRRKQDDEILADLEREAQANAEANGGQQQQQGEDGLDGGMMDSNDRYSSRMNEETTSERKKKRTQTLDSPDRNERKDKTYTTSLPREDAHRFRATLDEAVERLDLLGLITADNLRRRKDPQTSRTRKDIFSLMQREQDLEKMYEQLMHRRNELRGLSNKSKYLQNQSELNEITQALKQSTSSITANLKDHPTIVGNLNKIQKDRSALNQLLQMTSDELKEENYHGGNNPALQQTQPITTEEQPDGSQPAPTLGGYTPSYSYDVLVEQVLRRSEEQRLLIETKLRQEKTSEALKKLEVELENEWNEFEKLEDIKNAQIIELTNQLKHLKKVTALTVKYEQQTAIAQKETVDRLRANRINELKAAITRTKADLKTDKRVNKKSLVFLAKQKDAMDQLYEEWENNYEVDHGAKSREYEELTRARTTDQQQLVAKQTRWDEDNKQKVALMQEMAVRAKEEADYRALMDRMYLAQCTIRFYWRVYWRIRKKQLKKLRRKKLARLRAKRKAEKNRPPSFTRKKEEPTTDGEESPTSKPGSAAPAASSSKQGSAKPSAR